MTRTRALVLAAFVVARAIYAIGPHLVAPQSDRAANRCAEGTSTEVSSVAWQVLRIAGWWCRDGEGHETYLGWWA